MCIRDSITTKALIDEELPARGRFVYKENALVAGIGVVEEVMRQVSRDVSLEVLKEDSQAVAAGETAVIVEGPAGAILAAERVSLNFLSHLSGVATLTRLFVDAAAGTRAKILDTRKTTPGLRILEKYAVRCGGGENHRMGLYDQVLIKDNHLALARRSGGAGKLSDALAAVRGAVGTGIVIEVEAKNAEEVSAALDAGADIIMLDNMTLEEMTEMVAFIRRGRPSPPLIEASGGVTLETVAAIAATGVDRISVGALTHSAPSIDISLELE